MCVKVLKSCAWVFVVCGGVCVHVRVYFKHELRQEIDESWSWIIMIIHKLVQYIISNTFTQSQPLTLNPITDCKENIHTYTHTFPTLPHPHHPVTHTELHPHDPLIDKDEEEYEFH